MTTLVGELNWTGWALHRAAAVELDAHLHRHQPRLIVEAGSGQTTALLAGYAAHSGARVITLEHDPVYAGHTRALLARKNLTGYADLRLAPLAPLATPAGVFPWYDTPLPDGIDFALIDGPPEAIGRHAALFALHPHLAPGWEIWLDNADRPGEHECLTLWQTHLGARHHTMTTRHGAIARIRPHTATPPRIDASDVALTLLTGRRPGLLAAAVTALHHHAPGLLETAHVTILHNGGDPPTAALLATYPWADNIITCHGPMLHVGDATSRLFTTLPPDRPHHLHLQDDWTLATLTDTWLDDARTALTDPTIGQVRLRHHSEPVRTHHMVTGQPITWTRHNPAALTGHAHFTFNPSLTRTTDAPRLFPTPARDELHAMRRYHTTGLRVAQLTPGAFHHAGHHTSLLGHTWP